MAIGNSLDSQIGMCVPQPHLTGSPHTTEPIATRAWTEQRTIFIELYDGRTISFPATPTQE